MWQTTVILLSSVGEPGSFLNGVTSIPLDPPKPVENSEIKHDKERLRFVVKVAGVAGEFLFDLKASKRFKSPHPQKETSNENRKSGKLLPGETRKKQTSYLFAPKTSS